MRSRFLAIGCGVLSLAAARSATAYEGFIPSEEDTRFDAIGWYGAATFTLIDENTLLFSAHQINLNGPPTLAYFRRKADGTLGSASSSGGHYVAAVDTSTLVYNVDQDLAMIDLVGADPVPHISPIGVSPTQLSVTEPQTAFSVGYSDRSAGPLGGAGWTSQIAPRIIRYATTDELWFSSVGRRGWVGDSGGPTLVLNSQGDLEVVAVQRGQEVSRRVDNQTIGGVPIPIYPSGTTPVFNPGTGPALSPDTSFTLGSGVAIGYWNDPTVWTSGIPASTPNSSALVDEDGTVLILDSGTAGVRSLTVGKENATYLLHQAGELDQTLAGPGDYGSVMVLGHDAGADGRYIQQTAAPSYIGRGIIAGQEGYGVVGITGEADIGTSLIAGFETTGSGVIQLQSGGTISATRAVLDVGLRGSGQYTQYGGDADFAGVTLGRAETGTGDALIQGGNLEAHVVEVGVSGDGDLHLTGTNARIEVFSTYNQAGQLTVGGQNTGTGLVEIDAGTLDVDGNVAVGGTGSGTFQHDGGTVIATNINVGGAATSGVYTQAAGILTVNDTLTVGGTPGNTARFTLHGGTADTTATRVLTGQFELNGGQHNANTIEVGVDGEYIIDGGTFQTDGFKVNGALEFSSSQATNLNWTQGIVQFGDEASIQNGGNASWTLGPNTLLITSGYDPADDLATFQNNGLSHTSGTTLVIASGESVIGSAVLDDRVNVQAGGSLAANAGGYIEFGAGFNIEGTLDAGTGQLRALPGVTNTSSGNISGSADSRLTVEHDAAMDVTAGSIATDLIYVFGELSIGAATVDAPTGLGVGTTAQPPGAADAVLRLTDESAWFDLGLMFIAGTAHLEVDFDAQTPGTEIVIGTVDTAPFGNFESLTNPDYVGQGIDLAYDTGSLDLSLQFTNLLDGDANLNGHVEQGDLDAVLQNWGQFGTGYFNGDLNQNGQVEQGDLDLVIQNWGDTLGSGGGGSGVPEPNVAGVLLLGAALLRRAKYTVA